METLNVDHNSYKSQIYIGLSRLFFRVTILHLLADYDQLNECLLLKVQQQIAHASSRKRTYKTISET
jgi:hypothetical protein